jgi:2-polyprenyl-3-methyl-5-hydroxy-6-metoxy-1,4-benzoquinol methylase
MAKVQLLPEARLAPSEKRELRERLDQFYRKVPDYTAFHSASGQEHCWAPIGLELSRRLAAPSGASDPLRVLEVGAGRSGFGAWLESSGLRAAVHWTTQDVTDQNRVWLLEQADEFVLGDVSAVSPPTSFDVIFSTYVLEHTTDPTAHLDALRALLRPGGSMFLFCPRYDVPGYLCPSSRHLGIVGRVRLVFDMLRARLASLLSGTPAFLIQTDLAAFYGPFFTDADAVHWVSLTDLRLWARRSGLSMRRLRIGHPRVGTKDWIVKRWLTCAVELQAAP